MKDKSCKIYVAGHRGMVGSAIVRKLCHEGYTNLVVRTSQELDLCNQVAVDQFFKKENPEYVFVAAAKVGGIMANNTYRADFLYQNLMIESNVIYCSHLYKVKKLLFLGSSCIYPKLAPQPLKEESLLSGYLEETNEPYAIAKIAGIKLCENYRRQYGDDFISAMPTNLYGPNDHYDLRNSHVIPALIRKIHEAKINNEPEVQIWGSGNPMREFLHVDDLAEACLLLMRKYTDIQFVNVGTGQDISIVELTKLLKKIVNFEGNIVFDPSKPDGVMRKVLNLDTISALGWESKISLENGLRSVYEYYKEKTPFCDATTSQKK